MRHENFLSDKKYMVENTPITKEEDCLRTIILNVTDVCNLRCVHCPHSKGFNSPNYMNLSVVEELCKLENYKGLVSISGFGEPTLHPELMSILRLLHNKFNVELLSNGTTNFDYKEASKYCSKIKISLHSTSQVFNIDAPNISVRHHYLGSTEFCPTNRGGYLDLGDVKKGPCYYPYYSTFLDFDGHYLICGDDWLRTSRTSYSIFDKDIYSHFVNLRVKQKIGISREHCYKCCDNCSTQGIMIGSNFKDYYFNKHSEGILNG